MNANDEVPQEVFDALLRNAGFSADSGYLNAQQLGMPKVDCVRAALIAAFRCAIGNRMVSVRPVEEWAEWIAIDPPFDPDTALLSTKVSDENSTLSVRKQDSWSCKKCGSGQWVGWRAGPAHEGFQRYAQCAPCGHVQDLPKEGS